MSLNKRVAAECLGTFWLVLLSLGSAVISAGHPDLGIGFLGVGLASGVAWLAAGYAFGPISGAHLNPAVTLGLAVARRFPRAEILPYVLAQLLGAVLGAALLFVVASGRSGFAVADGFAASGYGDHSPAGYSIVSCFVAELALSFGFVSVVLGATDQRSSKSFTPLAIGLCYGAVQLFTLPVTGGSVNPARSTAPALFVQGWALSELWLFWAAPLAGALLAGVVYPMLASADEAAGATPRDAQPTASSSTSNTSVESGGITGGNPREP